MPITSVIKYLITVLLLFALHRVAQAAINEGKFYFRTTDAALGCVSLESNFRAFQTCGSRGSKFKTDSVLRNKLRSTSTLLPVSMFKDSRGFSLVVVARFASSSMSTLGYCGAGYEDKLFLIGLENGRATLSDESLLQSCLQSIVLESDKGDNPLDAITISKGGANVSFRWLGDPEGAIRIMIIRNKRFSIKTK